MSTAPQTAPEYPIVLSMPKAELITLCQRYGPMLRVENCVDRNGTPLDGPRLLWALAGQESCFGANLKPRHEKAWDVGGYYPKHNPEVAKFLEQWGAAGACSYGPLQVMAFNAKGFTPAELAQFPEDAFSAAAGFLNRWCLDHWKCRTLDAICDTYNSGNPRDAIVPQKYMDDVWKHYQNSTEVL